MFSHGNSWLFCFFFFFPYSAYQLCEQEVQQWWLEEPAEECWQLRQCPTMGSRHATVQEHLFGPLMVRRLSYLTCHWALPRFTSAAVQVFDCQESSFSAGAQAAVQWSDNRRLVDGWSESLEPRKRFFLGRVNRYQGFRPETHNKTGLLLICCTITQVSAAVPVPEYRQRMKEAMVGLRVCRHTKVPITIHV